MFRTARCASAAVAIALAAACAEPPAAEPQAAAPEPIEHTSLRLRLAEPPTGFAVTAGDEARWTFAAPLDGVQGTATIELRAPRSAAVNLAEEARAYGAAAAAAQGGQFFGGNELVAPYGTAYTVRVLADGGLVEERVVFLLHPDGSGRLLQLTLRYPPGDADAARGRLLQALELVGALEPLAAA